MWNLESILLFISLLAFFILAIYELLYYSEVAETEDWLGIKVPLPVKGILLVNPAVSFLIGLTVALYLILKAVR